MKFAVDRRTLFQFILLSLMTVCIVAQGAPEVDSLEHPMKGKWRLLKFEERSLSGVATGGLQGVLDVADRDYDLEISVNGRDIIKVHYKYSVNDTTDPKQFDIYDGDKLLGKGIYKIMGDHLWRATAKPECPRPKRFDEEAPADPVICTEWKRIKDDEHGPD